VTQVLGLQTNRVICCNATNLFWLGDPKEHPDLAAVLSSMGLPTDKAILSDEESYDRISRKGKWDSSGSFLSTQSIWFI
jgi:hypothetical protein